MTANPTEPYSAAIAALDEKVNELLVARRVLAGLRDGSVVLAGRGAAVVNVPTPPAAPYVPPRSTSLPAPAPSREVQPPGKLSPPSGQTAPATGDRPAAREPVKVATTPTPPTVPPQTVQPPTTSSAPPKSSTPCNGTDRQRMVAQWLTTTGPHTGSEIRQRFQIPIGSWGAIMPHPWFTREDRPGTTPPLYHVSAEGLAAIEGAKSQGNPSGPNPSDRPATSTPTVKPADPAVQGSTLGSNASK